jgi:hypothetical protein
MRLPLAPERLDDLGCNAHAVETNVEHDAAPQHDACKAAHGRVTEVVVQHALYPVVDQDDALRSIVKNSVLPLACFISVSRALTLALHREAAIDMGPGEHEM